MFEFTLSNKGKGNYVRPPGAGPAWHAFEAGRDMEKLEANLCLTPWERLLKYHKLLKERLQFETFMEQIYRNWKFIGSQRHVNLS
jgi:hypothetical protein